MSSAFGLNTEIKIHDMDINNYFYELPFEMKNQGTCLSNEASMNMTTPSVVWYLFCLVPVCIDQ